MNDTTAAVAARSGDASEPLIKATGLTKRFGEFTAVDGVDFQVAPGELVFLTGRSGAGKSTVARALASRLDAPAAMNPADFAAMRAALLQPRTIGITLGAEF